MFAQSMNPSREGLWTRLASMAAALAVVTSFALALAVLVSTVDNLKATRARAQLEQSQPVTVPVGG